MDKYLAKTMKLNDDFSVSCARNYAKLYISIQFTSYTKFNVTKTSFNKSKISIPEMQVSQQP